MNVVFNFLKKIRLCNLRYSCNFSYKKYIELARLNNLTGMFLLLYPGIAASIIAYKIHGSIYDISSIVIVLIIAILVRSSMVAFNDLMDYKFDVKNIRCKNRPIANGDINIKQAIVFIFLIISISVIIGLLFLDLHIIMIGIPIIIMCCIYPLTKRFFMFPQLFLGICFNLLALIIWKLSIDPNIIKYDILFILITAYCMLTFGYDTVYGFQDTESDILMGLKSSSIYAYKSVLGPKLFVIALYTLSYILFIFIGYILNASFLYKLMILITFSLMSIEVLILDITAVYLQYHSYVGFIYPGEHFKRHAYYGALIVLSMLFI